MVYCTKCGSVIQRGMKFCGHCAEPIDPRFASENNIYPQGTVVKNAENTKIAEALPAANILLLIAGIVGCVFWARGPLFGGLLDYFIALRIEYGIFVAIVVGIIVIRRKYADNNPATMVLLIVGIIGLALRAVTFAGIIPIYLIRYLYPIFTSGLGFEFIIPIIIGIWFRLSNDSLGSKLLMVFGIIGWGVKMFTGFIFPFAYTALYSSIGYTLIDIIRFGMLAAFVVMVIVSIRFRVLSRGAEPRT